MHTQKNELSFLRKLFEKCEKIDSAIPSPSVIGVIYECGGRLAMKDSRYQDAKAYFYKAFQAFDQSADYRRKSCLIYYVLAVMLDKKRVEETSINPFTSEETQIYKSDSEVRPFYDLFEAFNSLNLFQFNKVFHENEEYFYKDELNCKKLHKCK
ncbi:COP9 signalosome complex subunit 2-like [Zophobas morio]|uniref:COP9 signalosome complex subunit 2-like n=1 Tax=Zophobas morio TaxID=2755281 RepID=UPI0030830642